jgi:hypothetical protein
VNDPRSWGSWVTAVAAGLGLLATALLFAADLVEDAFGTPLSSPRTPVVVLPLVLVGIWTSVPAVLAAVAYRQRILGAPMALALALISPASVLYAAREVALDPDGSFVRFHYVFDPFWPNVVCASIVGAIAAMRALRRRRLEILE